MKPCKYISEDGTILDGFVLLESKHKQKTLILDRERSGIFFADISEEGEYEISDDNGMLIDLEHAEALSNG